MPKYRVHMTFNFSGDITVEADDADAAIDYVEANRDSAFQQAMEEGAFPDNEDIEVDFANRA